MGQYHMVVNLDKREYLHPHKLGCGLKLWEQLANGNIGGTGGGLIALLACSNGSGGGDLDTTTNWHGPERQFPEHDGCGGPMPESYADMARQVIGRWAGDRIAIVGDYAEDTDLAPEHKASTIYDRCYDPEDGKPVPDDLYTDISEMVLAVLAHELHLEIEDKSGWRRITRPEP